MKTPYCKVEKCGAPILALGFCSKHYVRFKRHGSPHIVHPEKRKADISWIGKTPFNRPPWWTFRKVTSEMIQEALKLRSLGYSYRKIADKCGVSIATTYWCVNPNAKPQFKIDKLKGWREKHSKDIKKYMKKYQTQRLSFDENFRAARRNMSRKCAAKAKRLSTPEWRLKKIEYLREYRKTQKERI